MPQLIRTPEEIFREEGKDIYCIHFKDAESADPPARREILAWLAKNTPGSRVEDLAYSEGSGCIGGYSGALRIDFSDADLAKFCARWEDASGTSTDPRFQCYLMPYARWLEKCMQFMPTIDRPSGLGVTKWWDTPIGFIYHQITQDAATNNESGMHPGNIFDIWFLAKQQWPELAQMDPMALTYGDIFRDRHGACFVMYACHDVFSSREKFSADREAKLREWFHLPVEAQVIEDRG